MIQVSGKSGEPLVVECRGKKVVSEVMLEKAEKRPLNKEVLAGQLGRLGGTEFQLGLVRNLLQGEVMIPLGELNRVRRRLVEELKEEVTKNNINEMEMEFGDLLFSSSWAFKVLERWV